MAPNLIFLIFFKKNHLTFLFLPFGVSLPFQTAISLYFLQNILQHSSWDGIERMKLGCQTFKILSFLMRAIHNNTRRWHYLRTQYGAVLRLILHRLGLKSFQSKCHFVQKSNTLFLGIQLSKYDGLISRGFLNSPVLFHSIA